MNEELDSQLSAMFDNELPGAECELLARRLSRDEELKARWSRYAAIGATIRAEGGPRLNVELARRVSVAISAEPPVVVTQEAAASAVAESTLAATSIRPRSRALATRWWAPVGGVAVAASVAAAAILWVRNQPIPQDSPAFAQVPVLTPSDQYVVPKANPRRSIVSATQLANYVIAHSEFSSPVNQRNLLS
ncbi:MAG: sigma-E factor negative regulatory protein, partial [Sinobacteraceae bacterium]|nr:sigma-E factor negative regulatory protein [Nevskiaceae bacterium]